MEEKTNSSLCQRYRFGFRLKIAFFTAIGSYSGILTALVLDHRLTTHVRFHEPRYYSHRWLWFMLPALVPLTTYFLLKYLRGKVWILLGSFLPLFVFGAVASLLFPPERPHVGILGSTFGFAVLSFLTTLVRISLVDYSREDIAPEVRFECIKSTIAMWQMIAVYSAAGYLAFAISWTYVVSVIAQMTASSEKDRFEIGEAGIFQIIAVSICVLLGPLYEAFKNAFTAVTQLTRPD
jgi:hypothetical protein